jgi:hypothetical protein
VSLEQPPRPRQRPGNLWVGQPAGWLDVDHLNRPVRAHQQETRDVTAGTPVRLGLQEEGLRGDRRHVAVEVGQQQPTC